MPAACSPWRRSPDAALRRFPIGIYDVSRPEQLDRLKADGFDSAFATPADAQTLRDLASRARRLGMRLVVPFNLAERLSAAETRDWPVDAWFLQDEPDVNKVSPESLRRMSEKVRAWDPARPQAFVIGHGSAAERYGAIADILMVDWYPVPHLPLDSVADHVDAALKPLPPGKPLWFVAQALDWRDVPQRDPKKPRVGRFPDHYEIRFMSYLAVVRGARGLYYYTLQAPNGKILFDFPELWQAVARVVWEIRAMQPIFESGRQALIPFGALEPGMDGRAWRWRGRTYVVLINRETEIPLPIPPQALERRWRPLFEPRRDLRELLEPCGRTWCLKPFQVVVLESRWGLRP